MSQVNTANVIAALCSFFIPGLGQLIQGRLIPALIMFILNVFLWIFGLGWIIHILAAYDSATYQ
jgi:TM2 domain-containing membrane protein YozV